jgi:hypothetical protein
MLVPSRQSNMVATSAALKDCTQPGQACSACGFSSKKPNRQPNVFAEKINQVELLL